MRDRGTLIRVGLVLTIAGGLLGWLVLYSLDHEQRGIDVCGRTYGHTPGMNKETYTVAELRRKDPRLAVVGRHEGRTVWAVTNDAGQGVPPCGLGVYVERDDGRLASYQLIGGL